MELSTTKKKDNSLKSDRTWSGAKSLPDTLAVQFLNPNELQFLHPQYDKKKKPCLITGKIIKTKFKISFVKHPAQWQFKTKYCFLSICIQCDVI